MPSDSMVDHRTERLDTDALTATLNYLAPSREPVVRYIVEPPSGAQRWNGVNDPRDVRIEDARHWPAPPTLDRNGFALVRAPTDFRNFRDAAEVERVYYPDTERLLRAELGAARVVAFDHNVRSGDSSGSGNVSKEPVLRVHNDYTWRSAPQRVRDLLGEEADVLLRGRFAIVNVWRPIRGPVLASPLALADGSRISEDDLIPTHLVYADRVGETFGVSFSPAHHWAYFSEQQTDEVLLIKCYDSATTGVPGFRSIPPSRTRWHPRTHRRARASRCGLWCSFRRGMSNREN